MRNKKERAKLVGICCSSGCGLKLLVTIVSAAFVLGLTSCNCNLAVQEKESVQ